MRSGLLQGLFLCVSLMFHSENDRLKDEPNNPVSPAGDFGVASMHPSGKPPAFMSTIDHAIYQEWPSVNCSPLTHDSGIHGRYYYPGLDLPSSVGTVPKRTEVRTTRFKQVKNSSGTSIFEDSRAPGMNTMFE